MTAAEYRFERRLDYSDWILYELDRRPDGNAMNGILLVLDRPVQRRDVDEVFAHMASVLPRLRQTILPAPANLTPPSWVDLPHLDVRDHVRHIRREAPLQMTELVALASEIYGLPLDADGPLWHGAYIEGPPGGPSGVVLCVHHALGDAAMFEAFLYDHLGRQADPDVVSTGAGARPEFDWLEAVRHRGAKVARGIAALSALASGGGLRAMRSTRKEIGEGPLLPGRHTAIRHLTVGSFGPQADWSRLARERGGGSNALFLAFSARVLARYCTEVGLPSRRLRVAMPIDVRADSEAQTAGNRIAVTVVGLEADAVQANDLAPVTDSIAAAMQPEGSNTYRRLSAVVEALPTRLWAEVNWRMWSGLADLGATSVGGRRKAYIGGAFVQEVYVMPMSMGLPVNVVRLIYDDRVFLSANLDPGLIRRPDVFDRVFADELASLHHEAERAEAGRTAVEP